MFYTIYKITNKINGKFYIGMHKTLNLDDGYMGSGKLIKRAIQKHGIKNFTKVILHIFDNEEDMKNKEKELVVINEMSYNLCDGGHGGFGYINKNNLSKINRLSFKSEQKRKKSLSIYKSNQLLNDEEKIKMKNISYLGRQAIKIKFPNGVWKNKIHSNETKQKMKNHKHQTGEKNSQYGTCWITNDQENKKIKKEELEKFIELGYYQGRL